MKIEEGKYYKANYTVDDIEDNLLTGVVLEKEKIDWNSIRIQAVIAAMQGILSGKYSICLDMKNDVLENSVVYRSLLLADKLISELKKGV